MLNLTWCALSPSVFSFHSSTLLHRSFPSCVSVASPRLTRLDRLAVPSDHPSPTPALTPRNQLPMSDDANTTSPTPALDPVHQLLQAGNGSSGAITAEQRNERREALLRRQRESREKAQQISQAARANAANGQQNTPSADSAALVQTLADPAPSLETTSTSIPAMTVSAAATPTVLPTPVRENMVQQAVSFLSSPSVQSADDSKKVQFLEKKGLTTQEIELAKARIAGKVSTPAVTAAVLPHQQQQSQQQQSHQPSTGSAGALAPPPVPPRGYAPAQTFVQSAYIPQQQVAAPVDPNTFKKKLVIALLISGGLTAFASIIVQKLIFPMVRGITGARQKLAISQTELLAKLKERLMRYREYLLSLHLGSNLSHVTKRIKDTKTTVEEEKDETESSLATDKTSVTTTSAASQNVAAASHQSTVKQLDVFSKKLESHASNLNFEQLKDTRAMTQDLAEYITKETYALTSSIAYPTSRYYGYNTAGAAASGKGALSDPTTPESALKSEIRSLKGLLLNWRNFPVAKEAGPSVASGGYTPPNLVQQH